jgi:hypothetical protein
MGRDETSVAGLALSSCIEAWGIFSSSQLSKLAGSDEL